MSLATDSPREPAAATVERRPSHADPEHSATVEGGWGATLPGGHTDAETTAPGPMAITTHPLRRLAARNDYRAGGGEAPH